MMAARLVRGVRLDDRWVTGVDVEHVLQVRHHLPRARRTTRTPRRRPGRDGVGVVVLLDAEGVAQEIGDREVGHFGGAGRAMALPPNEALGQAPA